MSFKQIAFKTMVLIKECLGAIVNYPSFVIWRVKYKSFPIIRGKVYINNYGRTEFGEKIRINSSLESSQLGFYPKTILHTSSTGKIVIGDGTGMSNCCLNARNRIVVGKNVRIGAGVKMFDNDFHNIFDLQNDDDAANIPSRPIYVEDNVFIGAGTIILKGVHIGKNAIIGAGSVVTKSVPEKELWAGNPAKKIRNLP